MVARLRGNRSFSRSHYYSFLKKCIYIITRHAVYKYDAPAVVSRGITEFIRFKTVDLTRISDRANIVHIKFSSEPQVQIIYILVIVVSQAFVSSLGRDFFLLPGYA